MTLTREEILGALTQRKRAVEQIEVPEWGGTVNIRRLSVADLKATGFLDKETDPADGAVRVLAACLSDEEGEPLFSQEDVAALAAAEFSVITRVFEEAARINGLSGEELDEATVAFGEAQDDGTSTA